MSRIRLAVWLAWNALLGRTSSLTFVHPGYGVQIVVGVTTPPKCNCRSASIGHIPGCPVYDASDYAGA
jgi:hypothetical protein